jgi:hypothetical protein
MATEMPNFIAALEVRMPFIVLGVEGVGTLYDATQTGFKMYLSLGTKNANTECEPLPSALLYLFCLTCSSSLLPVAAVSRSFVIQHANEA